IILREYEPAKYEIIAGERRYRAMKLLDWEKAPAIVEKMNDHETASLALIENLQRSELSSVEEAQAYEKLMDLNNLTQAKLAKGMGKS
ncbi:ParB/RepB/Spo0J family partition protein, partial [Bartonella sp. TT110JLCBS]|uniref:ParB/RepB/Spo0J family partition protein n=1 Tax=Bartonella sp. TT110JLCBS TaxID=3243578 RepID=UPI0035CF1F36